MDCPLLRILNLRPKPRNLPIMRKVHVFFSGIFFLLRAPWHISCPVHPTSMPRPLIVSEIKIRVACVFGLNLDDQC
jgi:hypothetical protein